MRYSERSLFGAIVFTVAAVTAGPALAVRPSCSEIETLRQAGQSVEQIMKGYGTTKARIEACERLNDQEKRFAAERQDFHQERDDRGLAH